jgi:hypothetical protein
MSMLGMIFATADNHHRSGQILSNIRTTLHAPSQILSATTMALIDTAHILLHKFALRIIHSPVDASRQGIRYHFIFKVTIRDYLLAYLACHAQRDIVSRLFDDTDARLHVRHY